MKVYQLYFKDSDKEAKEVFKTFYFEPANIYEDRRGSLFMAGQVGSDAVSSTDLLGHTAEFIKDGFYGPPSSTPAKSLREGLKQGNNFLRKRAELGEVEWLSSFNFAVLSLTPLSDPSEPKTDIRYELNFTKVGNTRIILLRNRETVNLGEKVKDADIEPYPLAVFSNIVSGQLKKGDRILILTGEIYKIFLEKDFLKKLAELNQLDEKTINRTLKAVTETKRPGVCLLIDVAFEQEISGKKLLFREKEQPAFEKIKKKFKPLERTKQGAVRLQKEVFSRLEKIEIFGIDKLSKINKSSLIRKLKLPNIKAPDLSRINLFRTREKINWGLGKKEIITIMLLVVLVWAGRSINRMEENRQIKETANKLEIVQEKKDSAWSLYRSGQEEEARRLYLDLWPEIVNLFKTGAVIMPEIAEVKKEIEREMYEANKINELDGIEPVVKFEGKEFLPQNFVVSNGKLFFSTPYSNKIAELEKDQSPVLREIETKVVGITTIAHEDRVLLLGEKGKIIIFNEELIEKNLISEEEAASFSLFSSFRSNLYFWQEKEKQIVRLSYLGDLTWEKPEFWLNQPLSEMQGSAKSMALDGGIWLLKGNELFYFYKGDPSKRINLAVFPAIRDLGGVYTSQKLSEIFISEPVENRILVIDKESGALVAQYKNPRFNNIKDLKVKDSILYILSGTEVYEIEL